MRMWALATTLVAALLGTAASTQASRAAARGGHTAGLRKRVGASTRTAACGHRLALGVDYYPEQDPQEDILVDMTAIKQDLGADFVRIGEFMWHILEPADGVFNFSLLDSIMDTAEKLNLEVMLGTPTATAPSWLYMAHPDIFARGPDSADGSAGVSLAFGGRRQASFHSKKYINYSKRIVKGLADRYGKRDIVTVWQIDNEMGNEQSDLDFSDAAGVAWRAWLVQKYRGDIGELNSLWGTVFWSVTYDNFQEIPLPRYTRPGGSLQGEEEFRSNMSPGMLLDYRRFRADALAAYADFQVGILRTSGVKGCLTTNINGGYWGRAFDNNAINAHMDFPAFDNYPVWGGSLAPDSPSRVALMLDTVRGWAPQKDRSAGFMVAEQLIGAQGHDIIGYTPRPGQIIAWSAQTLLHGATALAFFRYRAAAVGQEMFCYGILDQATPRGQGRKWQEARQLYQLARSHAGLWLGPVAPRVALLYSIDSVFSWNAQPQSTAFDYFAEAHRMYYPFWRNGAGIDVVSIPRILDLSAPDLLAKYSILLLPAPIIVPDRLLPLLESFVKLGGIAWVGFRADLKDDSNAVRRSASRLATLAGVEITEIESLNTPLTVTLKSAAAPGNTSAAWVWRDGLQIVPDSGTEAVWTYTDRFFGALGLAAVTRRTFPGPGGLVLYIGTGIDMEMLVPLATEALVQKAVPHTGISANDQVEQLFRTDANGTSWRVAINYGEEQADSVNGVLQPYQISIEPVTA